LTENQTIDFNSIRAAMAGFQLSPKVEPNEIIELDRAFFPVGHRGILDLKRQLVVGNRGVGKSFWTHALVNAELRAKLASVYGFPTLAKTDVVIGFNGSEKLGEVAPTIEELARALRDSRDPEMIWRAVLVRATHSLGNSETPPSLGETIRILRANPQIYAQRLSAADDALTREGRSLVVVFDALDRLAADWNGIRELTRGLLVRALGLQSFRSIRMKIFMRVDQFADPELFRFPDSSKIRNDYVNLAWRAHELFGLLFFELRRDLASRSALEALTERTLIRFGSETDNGFSSTGADEYAALVAKIAGEFMGGHKKRGRVYSWVPLHLSDAENNCSPRTFLTAWKSAAEHTPPPSDRVVDHLGLIDGVRRASSTRLTELREDYPWIDLALEPLRRQFVPIQKTDLFALWAKDRVVQSILDNARKNRWLAPIGVLDESSLGSLLQAMTSIAVMEERSNLKINVPDIFRVEAEILRKGGVAVPRRT
jgi:hypothetical protein